MTLREHFGLFASLLGDLATVLSGRRRLADRIAARGTADAAAGDGLDACGLRGAVRFERLMALARLALGAFVPGTLTLLLVLSRWWRGPGRGFGDLDPWDLLAVIPFYFLMLGGLVLHGLLLRPLVRLLGRCAGIEVSITAAPPTAQPAPEPPREGPERRDTPEAVYRPPGDDSPAPRRGREEKPWERRAKAVLLGLLVVGLVVVTHAVSVQKPERYWWAMAVLNGLLFGTLIAISAGVWFYRRLEASAEAELLRIYRECGAVGWSQEAQASGETVRVRAHTYHGFLAAQATTRHDALVPPETARRFLKRLMIFSLKRGTCGVGGLFVPFFCLACYLRETNRIERQVTALMNARDLR